MTQEELFADLKQFIEATVSQQMAQFATKEDLAQLATMEELADIKRNMATKEDMRVLDEKLDTIHDAIADTVQDHEQRIHRLEQTTA